MSTQTITRNLINSPLLAAIAYFTIMFIGGCYAKAEDKPAAAPQTAVVTPGIPVDGNIVQPCIKR
jgi:hypothetical protein